MRLKNVNQRGPETWHQLSIHDTQSHLQTDFKPLNICLWVESKVFCISCVRDIFNEAFYRYVDCNVKYVSKNIHYLKNKLVFIFIVIIFDWRKKNLNKQYNNCILQDYLKIQVQESLFSSVWNKSPCNINISKMWTNSYWYQFLVVLYLSVSPVIWPFMLLITSMYEQSKKRSKTKIQIKFLYIF